jgi:hypothetical protein
MQKGADWNTCVQNVTFIQESPISGILAIHCLSNFADLSVRYNHWLHL